MPWSVKHALQNYDRLVQGTQAALISLLLLFIRAWVGWVFFRSGLTKLTSWDSTLFLFELEYQVPFINWKLAAYLATATELLLPLFLVLGLLTRPTAIILFAFNIIAVVSYPALWEQGFYDHQLWGLMLAINIWGGAGKLSLDHIIRKIITIKH